MNIIALALSYYDKYHKENEVLYDTKYNIIINDKNNNRNVQIKLNENIVKEGYFNILGIFFPENNTFVWGWSLPYSSINNNSDKDQTYLSRRILNYALDMDFDSRNPMIYELRTELLSNKIKIEHPYQLEKLIAVSQYITKTQMVYKIKNEYSNADVWYLFEFSNL